MENALLETSRHLGLIQRQIEARAERMTITSRTKRRQSGRGTSTWTRADERTFRENIAALTLIRHAQVDALSRKLARQESAVAAFRQRYGIGPLAIVASPDRDRNCQISAAWVSQSDGASLWP